MTPFAGNSNFAVEIRNLIKVVSENNASVLLRGEKGTGKRLFAQNIHCEYAGTGNGFFEINCKSFSKENCDKIFLKIRESSTELKKTLFINYIELMDKELQIKLAGFIKNCSINNIVIKFICASEKNLEECVANGSFSQDLFYQINNVVLNFPPLRQRKEDIMPICQYYFNKFKKDSGICFEKISESAVELLNEYYWKGNVDELINSIQRGFIVGELPSIKAEDLGISFPGISNDYSSILSDNNLPMKNAIDEFKKYYVTKILIENNWNQTKTAKILGIQRTYVIRLMNELQIRK